MAANTLTAARIFAAPLSWIVAAGATAGPMLVMLFAFAICDETVERTQIILGGFEGIVAMLLAGIIVFALAYLRAATAGAAVRTSTDSVHSPLAV